MDSCIPFIAFIRDSRAKFLSYLDGEGKWILGLYLPMNEFLHQYYNVFQGSKLLDQIELKDSRLSDRKHLFYGFIYDS